MSPDDGRHGTYAGALKHRYDGETPCQPCKDASAAYQREFRATRTDWRVREAARKRAMSKLAMLHHDDFDRLYGEEMRIAFGQPRADAEVIRS